MLGKSKEGSLVAGAATYLVSNVANAAIPFALLPVLTRHLSPSQYGEVAMFQTLLAALAAVVGLSATGAANRKYYDAGVRQEDLKEFVGACLQILGATAVATLVLLVSFRATLSRWIGLDGGWMAAACVTIAATSVIQLRMGQWQVRGHARPYGALQVAQSLCNVSLSLALVVWLGQGAAGRIGAQTFTALAFAGVALLLLRRDGLLGLAWRPQYVKEALRFGVPLVPHAVGALLLALFDRFTINAQLGLEAVGTYMVAVQLASALGLVLDAVNKAYVPWLFERLRRDVREEQVQLVRLSYAWFAALLAIAGLAFLVGPIAVRVVAGPRYALAGSVLGWLVLAQAFGGMYLMVTNYLFYAKRTGLLSLASVGSGAVNVALVVLLVRSSGLVGAAVASALAMGIRFLATWSAAQRCHPLPWFSAALVRPVARGAPSPTRTHAAPRP